MSSNYEAITKHNERQLGLDTASRKTQVCMYSDSTHFIYEILQNADDYGASEILFKLSRTELVIEHNGKPFQKENVEAITYFGRSTSRDDLVKTGRFGVGFKSVFAFTATPVIISDTEHFRIHGLYRVELQPYPNGFSRERTRIVLPFNHENEKPDYVEDLMPSKQAFEKIESRLKGLNMNTLLFTTNIREIKWEIGGKTGHYFREDGYKKGGRETIITDGDKLCKYLVFAKTLSWRNQKYKDVELAFSINKKGQITPIEDTLYVLFPTTQETHLQFIVNGPYRTNPSRETISEEDSFNRHLVKETSELLSSILPELRDNGLLTINSLAVMPNKTDSLRSFYSPFFKAVCDAFHAEELVPTDDGKFASAGDVMQGPAAIRRVITNDELVFFLGNDNGRWAKGSVQNTRPDQFLKSLDIGFWSWEQLEDSLEAKFRIHYSFQTNATNEKWLEARSDQWMQKPYILLADAINKEECNAWSIQACEIVRVTIEKKLDHIDGTEAFFPKRRGYKALPQIKRSILRGKNKQQTKKIEDALVTLGVKQIGEEERIELILETFYQEEVSLSPKQHLDHMKLFIKWWKSEGSVGVFSGEHIFRVVGSSEVHVAGNCYLDSPLKASGLNVIYAKSRQGISPRLKLWTKYRELNSIGFSKFATACGVKANLSVMSQYCYDHPNNGYLKKDWYRPRVRRTNTSIDRDYTIENLSGLLEVNDRKINLLIWNLVRKADPKVLEAAYRPNQTYTIRKDRSSLVISLSKAQWIPNKRGSLMKPSAISKDQLHSSFKYDNRNGWLDEIKFGKDANEASADYLKKKGFAKELGVPLSFVNKLSEFSLDKQAELLNVFEATLKREAQVKTMAESEKRKSQPFHEALADSFFQSGSSQDASAISAGRGSRNPGRRRGKLQAEISSHMAGEPSSDTRFTFGLCKKWKGKNDQVRTSLLHWYDGKCQICGQTFLQRNNQPYFEGLYLVPYTSAEWIDRAGNVLCLCPTHSAMFQYGGKQVETNILEDVQAFVPRVEGGTTVTAT